MILRRAAAAAWLAHAGNSRLTDRRRGELTSGGDNDIVFHALRAGWQVGYFPGLHLTHLIPDSRLAPRYLGRLNRGIQQSWVQVLHQHDANPWPTLAPLGAALRQFRAWFTHRAWRGAPERIRWQGACGNFAGRALARNSPVLPRTPS